MGSTTVPLLERADSILVNALRPSPNHGERRGDRPDCLILHYTGMSSGPVAIAWLGNSASQVSCHYVVDEAGGILQMVAEGRRAWHAGRSSWHGDTDMNSRSIGIEIINGGHPGGLPSYPDVQVDAVIALCRDVVARYGIRPDRVLAHSDVAPGRKQDPGERFPWDRLFQAGIGLWVPPRVDGPGASFKLGDSGTSVEALQRDLRAYGYGIVADGQFGPETEKVVEAFQLHFRPARVDGIADAATVATLQDLLSAKSALA